MGFLSRFRKKKRQPKLSKSEKDTESSISELKKNILNLEYHYGFVSLQELKLDAALRAEGLRLATERKKRGLSYRV